MSTKTITEQHKLTTLKHLASGKGLDVVATIVDLPRETVLEIGSLHGYPDTEKLKWAADIVEKKIAGAASALPERQPSRDERPVSVVNTPQNPARQTPGTPAAAPEPLTRPDEIRVLLNTAKGHPSKRIQAAADKAIDALDRVKVLIREDQEKHAARRQAEAEKIAARAEVDRLERQLAEAKARLRGKAAEKKTTATVPGASANGDECPSAAEIRAWAADNDVECPAHGRVPGTVRQAYDSAHQDAA